jgi:hypothetical protein
VTNGVARSDRFSLALNKLSEVETLRDCVHSMSSHQLRDVVQVILDDIECSLRDEIRELSSTVPNLTVERKKRRIAGHSRHLLMKIKKVVHR